MKTPQFSVIMPCFNSAGYIREAILSVQAQTVDNWELLIADDCSTDSSADIVRQTAGQDDRVKFLPGTERGGPARARNRAIAAASGRYVAFLDADDRWTPEKLGKQHALHERAGCALSFTAYQKMNGDGDVDPRPILPKRQVRYRDMLSRNYMACSSVMVDREIVRDLSMPDIVRRQDYALWLQILREHDATAYAVEEPLLHYRVYPDSFSAPKLVSAQYHWRVLRDHERMSTISTIPYFLAYAVGAGGEYAIGKARAVLRRSAE